MKILITFSFFMFCASHSFAVITQDGAYVCSSDSRERLVEISSNHIIVKRRGFSERTYEISDDWSWKVDAASNGVGGYLRHYRLLTSSFSSRILALQESQGTVLAETFFRFSFDGKLIEMIGLGLNQHILKEQDFSDEDLTVSSVKFSCRDAN